MDYHLLWDLLRCHSTSGDEDEVRRVMTTAWRAAGWPVTAHGHYAVSARHPGAPPRTRARRPVVLITAHMDSPGFTVERIKDDHLTLIRLGSPRFGGASARGVLKTSRGHFPLTIDRTPGHEGRDSYAASYRGTVAIGDRVCYAAAPTVVHDRYVLAPFLDNRLGCFLLHALASDPAVREAQLPVDLHLAATTSEEFGGYGASVLARELHPDLTICLDATYEFREQQVLLGRGPVVTLSDASILLSLRTRERIRRWFTSRGLPVQMEAYNYSGTDARAFPHLGVPGPVLAWLIATTGNHTPSECAALADVATLKAALTALVHCAPLDWPA